MIIDNNLLENRNKYGLKVLKKIKDLNRSVIIFNKINDSIFTTKNKSNQQTGGVHGDTSLMELQAELRKIQPGNQLISRLLDKAALNAGETTANIDGLVRNINILKNFATELKQSNDANIRKAAELVNNRQDGRPISMELLPDNIMEDIRIAYDNIGAYFIEEDPANRTRFESTIRDEISAILQSVDALQDPLFTPRIKTILHNLIVNGFTELYAENINLNIAGTHPVPAQAPWNNLLSLKPEIPDDPPRGAGAGAMRFSDAARAAAAAAAAAQARAAGN